MKKATAESIEHHRDTSSWGFSEGDQLGTALLAWDQLGDGRRCETWLAWCTRRWSPVVVKLPRPGSLGERTLGALVREAQAVEALAHPGIQRLLEARLDAPVPLLVFEYVEGPTLADLLAEDGPLIPADVARLGLQVASALHYVHTQAVVHLDVKPANVGVRDGRALLMDFDVALPIGEVRSEARPRGTAAYMAPEQVRCAPASPSMDLFALGATLYEAATGEQAFEPVGEWPNRTYPQLAAPAPSARVVRAEVPRALDEALCALMDPDAAGRPSTARAALGLLASALPEGEEGLWPPWVSPAGPPTIEEWTRPTTGSSEW